MSFYCAIRTFKLTGYKLSLSGRTGHFTAPSGLLSVDHKRRKNEHLCIVIESFFIDNTS